MDASLDPAGGNCPPRPGAAQRARAGTGKPLEEREINGLTVAIPHELLPRVKEKIRSFRRELNEYLSHFEPEADDVFQLNIQLFRLTTKGSQK